MGPRGSVQGPNGPSAGLIRQELGKLLLHDKLKLSGRNRRFLAFVVNEGLEGRADRIKAYPIGVDVFGRGDDFDPTVDPIVRIEATRIRAALAAYYAGAGMDDQVRITIPPGSYIPTFSWGQPAEAVVAKPQIPHPPDTPAPSLAIVVTNLSSQHDRCAASRGELLTGAVVKGLSAAGCDVLIMAPAERKSPKRWIKPFFDAERSVYALDVMVHSLAEAKRYDCRLTDLWNRRVGWSESFDHSDDGHPSADLIDGLARRIVATVTSVAR